jgi:UrcA family protein
MRLILLALTAATIVTGPAIAEPRHATVDIGQSDLASSAGRAALNRRIANAVEQVCGSYASIESYQWPEMDECWRSARIQVERRLAERASAPALAAKAK